MLSTCCFFQRCWAANPWLGHQLFLSGWPMAGDENRTRAVFDLAVPQLVKSSSLSYLQEERWLSYTFGLVWLMCFQRGLRIFYPCEILLFKARAHINEFSAMYSVPSEEVEGQQKERSNKIWPRSTATEIQLKDLQAPLLSLPKAPPQHDSKRNSAERRLWEKSCRGIGNKSNVF